MDTVTGLSLTWEWNMAESWRIFRVAGEDLIHSEGQGGARGRGLQRTPGMLSGITSLVRLPQAHVYFTKLNT